MIVPLIMAGAAVAGVALQAYGMYQGSQASKEQAAAQQQIIALQQQAEGVRRQSMEISGRRQALQAVRDAQRARALALTRATAQGAGQGSGLQGGYGQIAGESGNNLLGIYQNLQFGRQMFDINAQISQAQMRLAAAGGNAATASGFSSLGGSIVNSLPAINRLSAGFGGSAPSTPSYYQPGGYGFVG